MWVAVYCRKSVDPGERGISVAVQERNGRRFAAEHWPDLPVRIYIDNDLSAANPAVTRPAYQRLISDVRAGNVAALVAREQSRLTRQPAEWESLCTTLQLAKLDTVHLTHGGPLSVAEGSRLPGRIMAVVDAEMVEQTRAKVLATLQANADDGRPHSSAGYGYLKATGEDGRPARVPDPDTAREVAAMVEAIARGDSLGVVADRLNRDGVPTPRGAAKWRRESVRAIVANPRNIGKRVHKGRVLPAQWEPIVDRHTWERAQARLEEAKPGTTRDLRRQYLLRGLVACAGCDKVLISSTMPTATGTVSAYKCPHHSRVDGACGKCTVRADHLEQHVVDLIAAELDGDVLERLNERLHADSIDTRPIHAELEAIEADLADLAVRRASGVLYDTEWMALRRTFVDRRQALMGQLAHAPVDELTVERVLAAWNAGGIVRRDIIPLLVETPILVAGAFRNGRRLKVDERVTLRFL